MLARRGACVETPSRTLHEAARPPASHVAGARSTSISRRKDSVSALLRNPHPRSLSGAGVGGRSSREKARMFVVLRGVEPPRGDPPGYSALLKSRFSRGRSRRHLLPMLLEGCGFPGGMCRS